MAKREIQNLELKFKYTNEYLRNGGVKKILDRELLNDLINVQYGIDGKPIPESITTRVNAFMGAILGSHLMPAVFHPEHISEYASLLQKSLSFEQINIDSPAKFDDLYNDMKEKTNVLFRGQREAKWRLYSSLQRHWILRKLYESEGSFQKLLEKMVEKGKIDFNEQIFELLNVHHIDTQNDVAVLGFLQHHGCPTPLLDWTYKFQNALYFGLDGLTQNTKIKEIEDYFSVYFIEEQYFEDSNMRAIIDKGLAEIGEQELYKWIAFLAKDKEKEQEMREHFAGRKMFDNDKITGSGLITHMTKIENLLGFPISYFSDKDIESQILFSLNNSKNIQNQDGVFTWNADPSKPLEIVGDELYKETYPDKDGSDYFFCSCINIHKSLEPHIRQRLDVDGIIKDYIYPTVDVNTWDIFENSLTK
jgi:hypothetical protein